MKNEKKKKVKIIEKSNDFNELNFKNELVSLLMHFDNI